MSSLSLGITEGGRLSLEKLKPNFHVVDELMDLSHKMYWSGVLRNPCSLKVLFEKYQFLQIEDEVYLSIM